MPVTGFQFEREGEQMIKVERNRFLKRRMRETDMKTEDRLAKIERAVYQESRIARLENYTIRSAGLIALLLTIFEVLIAKVADLSMFVVQLVALAWHVMPR
jgi:hypothetical protein